jgi:hypothetical protein
VAYAEGSRREWERKMDEVKHTLWIAEKCRFIYRRG